MNKTGSLVAGDGHVRLAGAGQVGGSGRGANRREQLSLAGACCRQGERGGREACTFSCKNGLFSILNTAAPTKAPTGNRATVIRPRPSFNTKQTRDAMLLDARKLHGFQTHSVPSLRSIKRVRVRYTKHGATRQRARQPTMTPEQCRGNPRVGLTRERMYDCKLCLGETGRREARGGQCSGEKCARCED